jgi:HlyD family secretion protein
MKFLIHKRLVLSAAAAVVVGLLAWTAWPQRVTVETATLSQGEFVRELVEDAQTRVRDRYTVAAPLTGHLLRPRLKPGDSVSAGDAVAAIAPIAPGLLDARSLAEQGERVAAMQAGLARAQAHLARAQSALQQATSELDRTESLAREGFVSSNQLESVRLTRQQRLQELTMAEQDRNSTAHDLQRLRIGLAQAGWPAAQGLWRVHSPVAGRVLRLYRDSEGPVASGALLMDIGNPSQLEIVTELLTEEAAGLPQQARAWLVHWGGAGRLQARLSRIEPGAWTRVSALGVQEQRVRVVLDWVEPPPAVLGDGYRMEIRIVVQQVQDARMAPVSTVFPHGSGHAVFVIDGGRVRLQAVQLRSRNGQDAWIETSLAPGTPLVAYPPTGLRAGDRVRTGG